MQQQILNLNSKDTMGKLTMELKGCFLPQPDGFLEMAWSWRVTEQLRNNAQQQTQEDARQNFDGGNKQVS